MNRFILLVVVIVALVSCKPGTPEQYIQPDELEDILYDLHLAQGMVYQGDDYHQYDYNRALYYHAVLKKHGLTPAEFDSSMVYYYKRADRLEPIYKRVAKRLGEDAVNMGVSESEIGQYSQLSSSGDTANIWNGELSAVLMPYPMHNRLDFYMKADSTYKMGDTFMLNMMMDFHFQGGTKEVEGCLLLVYDNDSVACRTTRMSFSGFNQLRLQSDERHLVKEIKGYVYLGRGNEESTMLRLLFIRDIQLIRMHKQEEKKEEVDPMKTDSVARIDMTEDSLTEPADSQSRFGRALPVGGRRPGMEGSGPVPRRDIKLKTN